VRAEESNVRDMKAKLELVQLRLHINNITSQNVHATTITE